MVVVIRLSSSGSVRVMVEGDRASGLVVKMVGLMMIRSRDTVDAKEGAYGGV
jgi:hypothetical protein